MIINHKYKFIFLKTRKTASTSIEIALSRFCDFHDVITPITEEDERMRKEFGFMGPRNYNVPLRNYSRVDWLTALAKRKRKKFFNHAPAKYIQTCIDEETWNSYFKFCFERNPFDKAISRYYWSTEEPRPDIADYLESVPVALLSNWDIYSSNDVIAVDFVGRFEQLADDAERVRKRLGLPEELVLPKAKSGFRKSREHYSCLLNEKARARLEIVCAKEIRAFDYRWTEPLG